MSKQEKPESPDPIPHSVDGEGIPDPTSQSIKDEAGGEDPRIGRERLDAAAVRMVQSRGYEILGESYQPDSCSHVLFLKHERSGARAVLVQNDDPLLRYELRFRTLPTDSSGVFHKLEHAVISESPMLPVADAFDEATRSLFLLEVNAGTGPDQTKYYATGADAESVRIMARVFVDATLKGRPSSETFLREHGHLVPDSKSPIGFRFRGVVFDEMVGYYSQPSLWVDREWSKALFATGPYRHDHGGDPLEMLDLSEEQYVADYENAYRTSKAVMGYYGNLPLERKLDLLDELVDGRSADGDIPSLPEPERNAQPRDLVAQVPYNSASDAPLESQHTLRLGWKFPKPADPQERLELHFLAALLGAHELSIFNHAFRDSHIQSRYTDAAVNRYGNEWVLGFEFAQSTQQGAEESKLFTLQTLSRLAEQGFPREFVDAILSDGESHHTQNVLDPNRGNYVLELMMSQAFAADYSSGVSFLDRVQTVRRKLEAGEPVFENLLKKYALNNSDRTSLVCEPSTVVREKWIAAQGEKVKRMLDALGPDGAEKAALVAQHMREFEERRDSPEALAQMPVASIPARMRTHTPIPISVREHAGAVVTHQAQKTGHDAKIVLQFDASDLTPEQQQLLQFLGGIMASLGPEGAEPGQFVQASAMVCSGIEAGVKTVAVERADGSLPAVLRNFSDISTTVAPENHQAVLQLMSKMLLNPQLGNIPHMKYAAEMTVTNMARGLDRPDAINGLLNLRLEALTSSLGETKQLQVHESAIRALMGIQARLEKDPEGLVRELRELHAKVYRRSNLTVSVTVDEEDWAHLERQIDAFITQLPSGEPIVAAPIGRRSGGSIGVLCELNNNYVGCSVEVLDENGAPWKEWGTATVAHAILDRHLNRQVRSQGGGYGANGNFNTDHRRAVFQSWQDPNIASSLAAMRDSVRFLREEATEDMVARAKVSSSKYWDAPRSGIQWGDVAINRHLAQSTPQMIDAGRAQIMDATLADVLRYAEALERGFEASPSVVVYGSRDALEKARAAGVDLTLVERI